MVGESICVGSSKLRVERQTVSGIAQIYVGYSISLEDRKVSLNQCGGREDRTYGALARSPSTDSSLRPVRL